jgi:hypothetical protein
MSNKRLQIKPSEADDLKIIRQISRTIVIPPKQSHKNKKAYSRRKKFKKDDL